jgi:hypothetical protein
MALRPSNTRARARRRRTLYRSASTMVGDGMSIMPIIASSARVGLVLTLLAAAASSQPLVDVFNIGEGGYYCIKIPYIITLKSGTIVAFGEARLGSCSDYTGTDLVYKRSLDGGGTWSVLRVLHGETNASQLAVIGNAAPVQDTASGRLVVPFCRNNSAVLQSYSDDDGVTWSPVTLVCV